MNQTASDYLIYDADDEATQEWFKTQYNKSTINTFFISQTLDLGHFKNNNMEVKMNQEEFSMGTEYIALEGNII